MVILGPDILEAFDVFLLDRYVGDVCLAEESINDDGDEQVEEDLRD